LSRRKPPAPAGKGHLQQRRAGPSTRKVHAGLPSALFAATRRRGNEAATRRPPSIAAAPGQASHSCRLDHLVSCSAAAGSLICRLSGSIFIPWSGALISARFRSFSPTSKAKPVKALGLQSHSPELPLRISKALES